MTGGALPHRGGASGVSPGSGDASGAPPHRGGASGAAAWAPPRDCPACGAPLRGWRSVASGEPGGAAAMLLRCPVCRTAVTAAPPLPDAHDSGAYATSSPRLAGAAAPVLGLFDRQRLALLRAAAPPPARLVDVGAGRGRFVAAARAAGYDAVGVEPSARGVTAAREVYGVELVRGSVEDLRGAPFDAAVLWHVLEHVDDPAGALRAVAAALRPGGVLVVGVPNLRSLQARAAGRRWFHLDAPRHRTHFTPDGLRALLAAQGFDVVREQHVLAEHNPFGLWQSLVPTRTPAFLYHLLKRNVRADPVDLAITLACLPLAPVAAAVELAAGLARRGGTIAVVARAGRSPAAS